MANQIVLKKSSVTSKVPVAGDLTYGELAINYADGRLYYKKADNTIDYFSSSTTLSDATKLPLSGGTMTGVITTPNGTHGIIIGDDSRLADRNTANTLFVEGNQNNDRGYINFGNTYGNSLGAIAGGALTWNGNNVLHAANYNAYAPTLTGTGASGTWNISVTGNAGSASVWQTARNLTIGNTSKSINGSADVSWSVGEIGAEIVQPNGVPRNNLGSPTVREMALFDEQFNNKTAFYNIANLKFYTSTDGITWTEYTGFSDIEKRKLLGGDASSNIEIPNLTQYFRIELTNNGDYVFLDALYMYWSSNSHSTTVKLRAQRGDGVWSQWTDSNTQVASWPGHLFLPFNTIAFNPSTTSTVHHRTIHIDFKPTWSTGTYATLPISLYKLQVWGGYPAGKRNIYSTDENRNVVFPAKLSGTDITATNFLGNQFITGTNNTSDTVSGSTWYGIGTASQLTDWNNGARVVQLSGYFGLRLRSSGAIMDFEPNGGTGSINVSTGSFKIGGNLALHTGNYSSYVNKIYDEGGSGNYVKLSSGNELEFYNAAGTVTDLYLNYSGTASSLRGPGGAIVLHANNYNSYAPTLTGTGASGTWGISITGNAATATSADQIDGVAFRNTGSNAGVNADTLDSNGITYYTGGVPNFSGNSLDGALYSQAYSSAWQHQIAADYRSGQIALRGKNNGTWQSWRTVLDSSNYTSYVGNGTLTVTAGTDLAGGGLLGTANQFGATSVTVNHADITRTNTTSTQTPARNGSFTVVDSVTTNARGHVTAVNTKTVTLPDFEILTFSESLTLTTAWQDTSINFTDLATGTYIVQVYVNDNGVGGQQWYQYYSGIMSWYSGDVNDSSSDEIVLHRAGHASNGGALFLRVLRTLSPDVAELKLQVAGALTNTGPATYVFKFRQMI